ncbi:hypothetical protein [Kordia jejudonensis]|uniref:hypothetical protein n=1 Tax=Kordia jejudonensis TaxID=1348245 RepID=UPI000628FFC1|nr:hypothetical protein [Kordia jejudonensis]
MKPFLFSLLCFFSVTILSAQNIPDSLFVPKLEAKQKAIFTLIDEKDLIDLKIAELKDAIGKTINDSIIKAKTAQKTKLEASSKKWNDSIYKQCTDFTTYKDYLKTYEKVHDSVLNKYKARECKLYIPEKTERNPNDFIIIGNNDPVPVDSLFSNSAATQVLANVFSIESKTNLGKFEVPGNDAYINFYYSERHKSDKENETFKELLTDSNSNLDDESYALTLRQIRATETKKVTGSDTKKKTVKTIKDSLIKRIPDGAKFQSIQIELREGGIVDTRLILESLDGNTHFYFEGTKPVSILHYTRKASQRAFLEYSHYVSKDGQAIYNESALKHLLVKYTDVLDYHPSVGSNYVPDDVSYTFPSGSTEELNKAGRRSYQIINNNNLQHVLDIRTYTDFLGLFGDEANGLFQIEGKADFFIHPFNFPRTAIYYFKKISPYVRYSRFDENEDFIAATLNTGTSEYEFDTKKLDLLERSTLEMGLDINTLNFRLFKESPFWTSLYIPFSYNVTNVQADPALEQINFKTLGYGLGAEIELRRFNNFGLNLGYEVKLYSYIGDYQEFNLVDPSRLKTQAVKAEIFYYPGLDRSQSVFLRMKSIRDISSGSDSFFQLQVGYRFTLGIGAVKAR